MVLIAIVIGSPLAWFLMHRWLQDFEYRTPTAWWIFVSGGLLGRRDRFCDGQLSRRSDRPGPTR